MIRPETLFGVEDFAREYIAGVCHHSDIRTEHLAGAVRRSFNLPSFPSLLDLNNLCVQLEIPVHRLPADVPMDGLNLWADAAGPEIHVREDLKRVRLETTICHEIREVLERAFQKANSGYVALDTADNRTMNPESDHFAGCLLMEADASRELLQLEGFDLFKFSRKTGRSLPSVIIRLQSLYAKASKESKPHAGIWLFDAPWDAIQRGGATIGQMSVGYMAHLCGFTMRKDKSQRSALARQLYPARGMKLTDFGLGYVAVEDRKPMIEHIKGFDMFGEHDFTMIAVPSYWADTTPWRLLVVAFRNDGLEMFQPWLERLSFAGEFTQLWTGPHVDRTSADY